MCNVEADTPRLAPVRIILLAALTASCGTASAHHAMGERQDRAVLPRGAGVRVTVAAGHVCVLVHGDAWCWGALPGGADEANWGNTPFLLEGGPFVDLSSGQQGTCGCTTDGTVRCWGLPGVRECAVRTASGGPAPSVVEGACSGVGVGSWDACVLSAAGDVRCSPGVRPSWVPGRASQSVASTLPEQASPEVSRGTDAACAFRPVQANPAASPAAMLAVGPMHACVVLASRGDDGVGGQLRCWGDNDYGALSDGPLESGVVAVPISGVERVAVGRAGTCAATAEGVTCWGGRAAAPTADELAACRGVTARLTDPDSIHSLVVAGGPCRFPPRTIAGLGHVREIAVGDHRACAITDAAELVCWGGAHDEASSPLAGSVVALGMGGDSGCFANESGEVWCWGRVTQRLSEEDMGFSYANSPPGMRVAQVSERGVVELVPAGTGAPP